MNKLPIIALRPRLGTASWNKGKVVRGDREIWAAPNPFNLEPGEISPTLFEKWGSVLMVGHGCHGPTYEFYNADGQGIEIPESEHVRGKRKERYGREEVDKRSTDQRIVDKAYELIAAGRLPSPAELKAKADERKTLMRDALRSLNARTDLTNAEREGLALAYREIFHNPLPTD
jgi:hypothetical protein